MKTFSVTYRIVPESIPHVAVTLRYTVDAVRAHLAEQSAYSIMEEDVRHMFGHFDTAWLKRTTTTRINSVK